MEGNQVFGNHSWVLFIFLIIVLVSSGCYNKTSDCMA